MVLDPTPTDRAAGEELWQHVVVPSLAAAGSVTSSTLRERGVSAPMLRSWVAAGRLVRLRRNLLVDGAVWTSAAPWERHAIRARAYAAVGEAVVLSHHSALALMDISLYGVDDLVHACALTGRSRRTTGLVVHRPVMEEHTTDAFGARTVVPAMACAQVAAVFGLEAGVVAADSALRSGRCTREELQAMVDVPWLFASRPVVGLLASVATEQHESAGESRCYLLLSRLGHADAQRQVWILDDAGVAFARVDFLLRGGRVVVEFDGEVKYAGRADLLAEKRRQDRLTDLGYEVVRITWRDLDDPGAVAARIDAALRRSSRRAG